MPECEFPKLVPHPLRVPPRAGLGEGGGVGGDAQGEMGGDTWGDAWRDGAAHPYAELCVTSNYAFLRGASHPEEHVARAAELGYVAVAIADLHTLGGIVRAHVAAKRVREECASRRAGACAGPLTSLVVGSRVRPTDLPGWSVCLYATGMASYRGLCRLLTTGKRRAAKGECEVSLADLAQHAAGLLALALRDPGDALHAPMPDARACAGALERLREILDDDRLSLGITRSGAPGEHARTEALIAAGSRARVPLVATNDALYHVAERRMLQDVLTCVRLGCSLPEAGLRLHANAERHLRGAGEMHRVFADMPEALRRTVAIAERARGFSLDELRYEYPEEVVPVGSTPQQHLERLTWEGARERYPGGVPPKVRAQVEHELRLIEELRYAPYFLTVHDVVRFARSRPKPILCQGRGAAANSAVCYCLGVTSVDPDRISVLFERFVSKERNEPPDIDIDFEHERREEVIQYIYGKYGRERAALTAEVITYRRRSAVRDVGKALGLSRDVIERLAKDNEWWDEGDVKPSSLRAMGLNPADPVMRWHARLTRELMGFPRHRSQHVGGFVITRTPLCELVPVENAAMPDRTVIEWDKDDVDAAGMLKVDVLGLGMLTAIRRCLELINRTRQGEALELHTIPPEDPATYAMIQRADTVGVFQIESRAQMSMLPRLKPACFYDLVIEVAIVRPGPIQGDMVHPYLRRRNGEEDVSYPSEEVRGVLGRTLGVPLFQEQAMQLAIVAAGFTPGEADSLRRAMAAWKRKGDLIYRFGSKLVEGMVRRGYPEEFARRCFEQIKGFSEYGFPESHAASFALLVYVSCWLKRHYPAHFTAALINSQPMGFYAPAQLVRDAQAHGVVVKPADARRSGWDCCIESDGSLRLGLRLIKGLSRPEAEKVTRALARGAGDMSVQTLWRRSGASAGCLRTLAAADALACLGLSRQQALWQTQALRDEPLPLFDAVCDAGESGGVQADDPATGHADLPEMGALAQVSQDYARTGLSLRAHPISFLRGRLGAKGVVPCAHLREEARTPDGAVVRVAGLVLVRQRPGTASGVVFITLEDETGIANLILWSRTFERVRRVACHSNAVIAVGRVQREGEVVHVLVSRMLPADPMLEGLRAASRDFH